MKTAGIIIDAYKLPVFKRVLDASGYKYTEHKGPSSDTLILKVEYAWVHALKPVIEQANKEAALSKRI